MHEVLIATLFVSLIVAPAWIAMGASQDKENG